MTTSLEYAYLRNRIKRLLKCSKTETMYFLLLAIEGAVTALEANTNQFLGHSSEVAVIAGTFAQKIGLSDKDIYTIKISALLHDIGKAILAPLVVSKPECDEQSINLCLKHADIGALIIRRITARADIADTVLCHHAHWDGTGYPCSLSGKDIPLGSRIISLANTYQVMTAGDYGRYGRHPRIALAAIRRLSGTQFDPALARQFVDIGGHALW